MSWIDSLGKFGNTAADIYDRFTDDPVQQDQTQAPPESVPNYYAPPTQESQGRPYDLTPSTSGFSGAGLVILALLALVAVEIVD